MCETFRLNINAKIIKETHTHTRDECWITETPALELNKEIRTLKTVYKFLTVVWLKALPQTTPVHHCKIIKAQIRLINY